MGYTQEELRNKLLDMYPEISKYPHIGGIEEKISGS